jgi:phage gp45-like
MRRSTTRSNGDRVGNAAKRATVSKTNDTPLMQEIDLDLHHEEKMVEIENFQPYGLAYRVKPPTTEGGKKRKAEAVVVFTGGNRSHGVVVVVGDRRYRLKDMADGEVAIYDDQKQKVHLTRDGIVVDGGPSKKPVKVTVGNATLNVKDGEISAKVVALAIYVTPTRIDLGKKNAPHAVVTVDGPSEKVFAVIGESDG